MTERHPVIFLGAGPGDPELITVKGQQALARAVLTQAGWEVEVTQLQVSRSQPLAGGSYLQALNPVWIVAGYSI